mmetsp:Transcript_38436/g.75463  ORF Transcript_38436/g.75463 Transcript_38436/m.75463 type:complete len:179 (+) Transcript_38436:552-1088(+)
MKGGSRVKPRRRDRNEARNLSGAKGSRIVCTYSAHTSTLRKSYRERELRTKTYRQRKRERERERERERDRAQSLQGGRKATKCLQKRCAGQKERAGGTYQRTEVHTRVSSGLSLLVLSSFPLSFVCLSVCLPFHVFFFLLFSRPHMRTRKQCVFLSPPFLISVCSFGISFLSEGKKGG